MTTLPQRGSFPPVLQPAGPRVARIGVTGHREIADPGAIRRGVGEVLGELDARLASVKYRYRVVSPLADGADRIVARYILQHCSDSDLEAVLPMPREAYHQTFNATKRDESIDDFESLWKQAQPQIVLAEPPTHPAAYEQVGAYIVEHCEVLIAVWDGQPERGRGGTATVVRLARDRQRTIFWIDAVTGSIHERYNLEKFATDVARLEEYNQEIVDAEQISQEANARLQKMEKRAIEADLDPSILKPLSLLVLPHHAKASGLARKYQRLYFWATYAAYLLSALAVLTAAFAALIFPHQHALYLAEVAEIMIVMGLTLTPLYRSWQRKWIDHRYLAERLRASCFLFVVDLYDHIPETPADLRLSWLPDSWVVLAMAGIFESLRELPGHPRPHRDAKDGLTVGKFLRLAWIDDQQKYYERKSASNRRLDNYLEKGLLALFVTTLLVALWHFYLGGRAPILESNLSIGRVHGTEAWLSVIAVALPAFASAIAGISVFRHFDRIAERYESMSEHLRNISELIEVPLPAFVPAPPTRPAVALSRLQELVRDADRTMMHEHQGWRAVIGVHLPGPG